MSNGTNSGFSMPTKELDWWSEATIDAMVRFGTTTHTPNELAWQDVGANVMRMDSLYDASFHDWLKCEDNVGITASYLQRIANEYPLDRIINALRWLVSSWRVESTAHIVRHVTSDWAIPANGAFPPHQPFRIDSLTSNSSPRIDDAVLAGETRRGVLVRELAKDWSCQQVAQLVSILSLTFWRERTQLEAFLKALVLDWDFCRLSSFFSYISGQLGLDYRVKVSMLQQAARRNAKLSLKRAHSRTCNKLSSSDTSTAVSENKRQCRSPSRTNTGTSTDSDTVPATTTITSNSDSNTDTGTQDGVPTLNSESRTTTLADTTSPARETPTSLESGVSREPTSAIDGHIIIASESPAAGSTSSEQYSSSSALVSTDASSSASSERQQHQQNSSASLNTDSSSSRSHGSIPAPINANNTPTSFTRTSSSATLRLNSQPSSPSSPSCSSSYANTNSRSGDSSVRLSRGDNISTTTPSSPTSSSSSTHGPIPSIAVPISDSESSHYCSAANDNMRTTSRMGQNIQDNRTPRNSTSSNTTTIEDHHHDHHGLQSRIIGRRPLTPQIMSGVFSIPPSDQPPASATHPLQSIYRPGSPTHHISPTRPVQRLHASSISAASQQQPPLSTSTIVASMVNDTRHHQLVAEASRHVAALRENIEAVGGSSDTHSSQGMQVPTPHSSITMAPGGSPQRSAVHTVLAQEFRARTTSENECGQFDGPGSAHLALPIPQPPESGANASGFCAHTAATTIGRNPSSAGYDVLGIVMSANTVAEATGGSGGTTTVAMSAVVTAGNGSVEEQSEMVMR